jgi:hypothetical protein
MKNCKNRNPTFKCDGCGIEKSIKEKFKIVDENFKVQKGLFICASCKGL